MASSTSDRPPVRSRDSSGNARVAVRDPEATLKTFGVRGRGGFASDGDTMEQPRSSRSNPLPSMSQLPMFSPPAVSSAPGSTANSTYSSRESSPVHIAARRQSNSTPASRSALSRTSNSNISPSRGPGSLGPPPTSIPAVGVQISKSDLQPSAVETSLDVPNSDKSNMLPRALDTNLQGPAASRWKVSTTGPTARGAGSGTPSRRLENESTPANTSSKRAAVSSSPGDVVSTKPDTNGGDPSARSGIRVLGRGASGGLPTLETVQEASLPSTPSVDRSLKSYPADVQLRQGDDDTGAKAAKQATESGSDSGGNKSSASKEEKRRQSADLPRVGGVPLKRSLTSLSGARGKPSDGSARLMIVETETVSSVPQVALGVGGGERGPSGRADLGGTIRMKSSVETIRPRREKKKTTRKPPALPGTASSKADIFEAKVASAVDEADVSDSDETFVYESNPQEPHPGRQFRYHSRTPSTTSMASQADQFASRPRPSLRDGHSITGKRSMKFTNNNNYNGSLDGEGGEIDKGRSNSRGDANGHSGRHHHVGRHGRNPSYPALFDADYAFPQPQAPRSPRHFIGSGTRQNRRGPYRLLPNYRTIPGSKNMGDYGDDFDADGADDERTPLVTSSRAPRSRHGRRPNSASLRQMEYLEQRQRSCFSRYGGCVIAIFLALIMIGGAATFIIAMTKPLLDLHVKEIRNVLASEQKIIFDLDVMAINPNIFPLAIDNMDVSVFARSRYVGGEKFWRLHGPHPDFPRIEESRRRAERAWLVKRLAMPPTSSVGSPSLGVHATGGVDKGTDPIFDDPSTDPQTMLLGRVFLFDSPLIFDPSPWARRISKSTGQISLSHPGNKTEEGGSERWERVLQHPFELIVRGVVKYSLPLSSSVQSASISSKIQVSPAEDDDDEGEGNHGHDHDSGPSHNDTVQISITSSRRALEAAKRS